METGTTTVYDGTLLAAVQSGKASLVQVNEAVLRILTTMFRIGLFDTDTTTTARSRSRRTRGRTADRGQSHHLAEELRSHPAARPRGRGLHRIDRGGREHPVGRERIGLGRPHHPPPPCRGSPPGPAPALYLDPRQRPGQRRVDDRDRRPDHGAVLGPPRRGRIPRADHRYWHAPGFAVSRPSPAPRAGQLRRRVPHHLPAMARGGNSGPAAADQLPARGAVGPLRRLPHRTGTGRYHLSLTGWGDATMTLDGRPFITMAGQDGRRVARHACG